MLFQVRLFAAYRDRAGMATVSVDVATPATMGDVVDAVIRAVPALEAVASSARPVVNREFVDRAMLVAPDDDLALLPPVSGGADADFWLTDRPLDPREVEARVADPACGALVTFVGTVRATNEGRTVSYLEYEAFPGMAEAKMAVIGAEIAARYGPARVAIVHRLGRCEVGDASIVISVAAPHRDAAFLGCRHAIDRVKEIVPIWKREVWSDGAVWIGMHA